MIVVVGVGLGLFLLFLGAAIINAGHTVIVNPSAEQTANNTNLVVVWGPTILSLGLFFLVGGLLFGVAALEDLDVFVRLFLMILAFVAVLLILASPATFFP